MEITYENIQPVLKQETWENNMVRCTFQVEGKEPVQAFGQVMMDQNEMVKTAVKSSVKQGIVYSIIRGIARAFGGMFGGIGGAVVSTGVSSVGYTVASHKMNNSNMYQAKLTPENKREAVVNAFKSVGNFFKYDEASQQWVSAF